jgi:Spy/CpxP family protein refolding chaperone
MKRILLTSTLALTLAATAAFAQQATQPSGDATTTQQPSAQQGGHHRGQGKMDPHKAALHVGKRLGLSEDQTAKLEPIFADSQQKMLALRSNTSLTPDQRHEQMRSIHKDTQTQLSTVLTPDQMQQLHGMRRGPHGRHQGGGQQPEAATPPSAS